MTNDNDNHEHPSWRGFVAYLQELIPLPLLGAAVGVGMVTGTAMAWLFPT